ncbi:hypothetical protein RhiirA5_416367 [Rhizophagus irregularis]|uniref:Uncharacterized protein n=1 Tax=Rhizophagus irregularis TaxID=588596 RepID=A0A2N0PQ17_9GLOM|nr:hypothetical protein RhiirA5_416367 [Rhizophagus irregularis]
MSKLLKCKSELEYIKLSNENISLELANTELKDILAKKKDELMRVRDDLLSAQKAVIEKDSLLQETNSLLLEHISKTSSESKQNEAIGDKGLEKGNKISSPKITSESSYSSFFQHAIIFTIATKHESFQNIRHPAMSWPFAMLVTERSGTVCGYHPDKLKWTFVRYMYGLIASNSKAPYYKNIRFSYISSERIPNVKSFSPERSTVIIFENLCVAPKVAG